ICLLNSAENVRLAWAIVVLLLLFCCVFLIALIFSVQLSVADPYIRFHDLRHTSATLLINQGNSKIISERLGHGSINTTMNIYGHALRSADQAAADKLEQLFAPRKEKHDKKTLG
ncbi:tyrosine-type recombinase/integrase, partial [Paenibacillus caui]|uniref:tyrosine-type recombinase/integrase n=1 Tax=Paenibacillus caui TaxID=2873927 RepID=UPI001CA950AB